LSPLDVGKPAMLQTVERQNMNMIDSALGVHAQALGLRSHRMEVLSKNLANADTPNFKAQDVDFMKVLQSAKEDLINTTNKQHIEMLPPETANGLMYRIPFNVAFDGNTVEMNVEQAKFGQSAADYQTTLNILENRVTGIRRALRGD
jgi:flagellar basal-body rod protein FlgB